jgi:hypothetical protein
MVHYSCESFYDLKEGATPRISGIACRNFKTGQTVSFSIIQSAELPEFRDVDILDDYELIEKHMLDRFFEYVRNSDWVSYWVHWNMRDVNYGFSALEHRYRVLGGDPSVIPDIKKFDLARGLVAKYGKRYAGHPRLQSLMKINRITDKSFLGGKDEAYAFKDKEFLKLHQSTLRKVDVMSNIMEMVLDGKLRTKAPFWDRYGGSVRQIWEKYVSTPLGVIFSILLVVLTMVEWLVPTAKVDFSEYVWSIFQSAAVEGENALSDGKK